MFVYFIDNMCVGVGELYLKRVNVVCVGVGACERKRERERQR
jgi:hypothetical protein